MGGINEIAGSTVAIMFGLCGNLARHLSRKVQQGKKHLGKWNKDLDRVQPRGTFIWAETSPFLPYLGGGTVSTNGCEQEGRDQCDAKEGEGNHPCTRKRQRPKFGPRPIEGAFIV